MSKHGRFVKQDLFVDLKSFLLHEESSPSRWLIFMKWLSENWSLCKTQIAHMILFFSCTTKWHHFRFSWPHFVSIDPEKSLSCLFLFMRRAWRTAWILASPRLSACPILAANRYSEFLTAAVSALLIYRQVDIRTSYTCLRVFLVCSKWESVGWLLHTS